MYKYDILKMNKNMNLRIIKRTLFNESKYFREQIISKELLNIGEQEEDFEDFYIVQILIKKGIILKSYKWEDYKTGDITQPKLKFKTKKEAYRYIKYLLKKDVIIKKDLSVLSKQLINNAS